MYIIVLVLVHTYISIESTWVMNVNEEWCDQKKLERKSERKYVLPELMPYKL